MAKKIKVTLGSGEELVLIGHEIAILSPGDEGELNVYTAEDWRATCAPSFQIDEDGDLRNHNGERCYGAPVAHRFARCPSEQGRFKRLFAKRFADNLRVAA